MALGSFVEGLQGGLQVGQGVRRHRQRERADEYILEQAGRENAAARANAGDVSQEERDYYGANVTNPFLPEVGRDPVMYRFMDWFSKKKGGRRSSALPGAPKPQMPMPAQPTGDYAAAAPAAPGVPNDAGTTSYGYDEPEFADGGDVTEEDKIRERAARNRARAPGRVENATETVEGRDETKPKTRAPKPQTALPEPKAPRKPMGAIKGTGMAILGAAAGSGAVAGLNTPTEEYYRRQGLDPAEEGLSVWRDVGVRAKGVMGDVINSLPFMGGDAEANTPAPAAPARAPAPQATALPSGPVERAPAPAAVRPAAPQDGDAIDLSNIDVDASELPAMNTDDWKMYRAQMLRTARLQGLPQAQAREQADQMVTNMQMRGFSQYAAQTKALLEAGNLQGASRALRMAYQYFPDGKDTKIGIQNGNLVAVALDEKTGKPREGSKIITPEFLAGAIQNFADPKNYLAWTKDWRDYEQGQREYDEIKKPQAQAAIDFYGDRGTALKARAGLQGVGAVGGVGGLKPSDMRGSEKVFRDRNELASLQNPAEADMLAGVMSQIKMREPNLPDNVIVQRIMAAHADGTLMDKLAQLGVQ